jgi:hypothetical protein
VIATPPLGAEIQPMHGLTVRRNTLNEFLVLRIHYEADPNKRGQWKYRASPKYGGLKSWRWRREMEIDWDAQAGKLVFEMWNRHEHGIRPRSIPEHWPRWLMIDPGWRNPTSMVWMAVDTDTEPNEFGFLPVHFYREFYKPKHSPAFCAAIASEWSFTATDELGKQTWEWIEAIILDPAAKQETQGAVDGENTNEIAETFMSRFEAKLAEIGWAVPVETGNNFKDEAIDEIITRLGAYWISGPGGIPLYDEQNNFREATLEEIAAGAYRVEPTLFFHECCIDGMREMGKYRWRDWAASDVAERHNDPERPIDKDDHTVTNVIRAINTLRSLRTEGGPDLSEYEGRSKPRRWVPDAEVIETRHKQLASRHRLRIRKRRRDA